MAKRKSRGTQPGPPKKLSKGRKEPVRAAQVSAVPHKGAISKAKGVEDDVTKWWPVTEFKRLDWNGKSALDTYMDNQLKLRPWGNARGCNGAGRDVHVYLSGFFEALERQPPLYGKLLTWRDVLDILPTLMDSGDDLELKALDVAYDRCRWRYGPFRSSGNGRAL